MQVVSPQTIPDLSGRTALVTGATSGIGLEAARLLSKAGARVILAGRDTRKGATALYRVGQNEAHARLSFEPFDLGELSQVEDAAGRIMREHDRLDILINNAGVMAPKDRATTKDDFELQFGTNHLAHFALTGHLLPLLRRTPGARVVSVASLAARFGQMDFDDLQSTAQYRPMQVYGQSKLANLLFIRELARRSAMHSWGVLAAAAHPGWSRTNLVANGPGKGGVTGFFGGVFEPLLAQSATDGALPVITAATDPDIAPNDYVGPDRWFGLKGAPARAGRPARADSDADAQRLWDMSEALTGVRFARMASQVAG